MLKAFGLENVIDIEAIKAFAENIEETLENPEQLLSDITGVNITALIEDFVANIPDDIDEITNVLREATLKIDIKGYMPLRDPFGPYFFFPKHCYPEGVGGKSLDEATQYNSPVIAYVKTGSSIERDIIKQLESLFRFQKTFVSELATLDILGVATGFFDINTFAGPLEDTGLVRPDEIAAYGDSLSKQFGINGT